MTDQPRPEPFVAGPVWLDHDEDPPLWTTEVQVVGGHEVAATIYAGSKEAAEWRRDQVVAAWNAAREPDAWLGGIPVYHHG